MPKNTILLIDSDQLTLNWLSNLLTKAGYFVETAHTGVEGLTKIVSERPDLVIFELVLPDMNSEQVCDAIFQNPASAEIPLLILSSENNPQVIAEMYERGITDYIVKRPGSENEILGKCAGLLRHTRSTTRILTTGRLISFFSAKGGNGTSTLCLNLAHTLARLAAPKTVLVADMVLPLGSLSIITGSQHTDSIAQLTTEEGAYDYKKLKEYVSPTEKWGFSILQGSHTPHDAQNFNPDQLEALFDSLFLTFNYVIVDVGKTLSRISQFILERSETIVVVVGPDPLTVELTHASLQYLFDLGIEKEKLFPVLNRAVGREGLTKSEIEGRLNLPIQGSVPYAQNNFNLASNQNLPHALRFPDDVVSMALSDLAVALRKRIDRN